MVKPPPARILPSACTARDLKVSFAPGLKLGSRVPSALSRQILFRLCPFSRVKSPPTRISPSACTAREYTKGNNAPPPPGPGLKESGKDKFTLNNATELVALPHALLTTTS